MGMFSAARTLRITLYRPSVRDGAHDGGTQDKGGNRSRISAPTMGVDFHFFEFFRSQASGLLMICPEQRACQCRVQQGCPRQGFDLILGQLQFVGNSDSIGPHGCDACAWCGPWLQC